jgi:lipoprotein-releasing system permease protein
MTQTFHWLVAFRYLRRRTASSRWLFWIPGSLLLFRLLFSIFRYALYHNRAAWLDHLRFSATVPLAIMPWILGVGFVLTLVFVLLIRRFTIFTTISTYGLFLGSAALVIVLSVMSGFENDLKQKILGTDAHIVVTGRDQSLPNYVELQKRILATPKIVGVTPYLENEVMIASPSNLSGVVLRGIDPATVGQVTDLRRNLEAGDLDDLSHPERLRPTGEPPSFKDATEPSPKSADQEATSPAKAKVLPGVIVGRELAKNLRVYVGDEVNIISPLGGIGPQGPIPKSKPFRVAGIFYSGMFEYDTKYAYLSIPAAQRFLDEEDQVTGFECKVSDPDHTRPIVAALKSVLGPSYDVQDWQERKGNLFSALKLEKIAMFIVLCFIILVAAFSIIANGIMLVMEKGREIAILKSMGASDRAILVIFIILGLYMGALGTLGGIAAGVFGCEALRRWGILLDSDVYYITKLPVQMNAGEIIAVFVAALVIALLATLYPAWAAARLRPVEGLRDNR